MLQNLMGSLTAAFPAREVCDLRAEASFSLTKPPLGGADVASCTISHHLTPDPSRAAAAVVAAAAWLLLSEG